MRLTNEKLSKNYIIIFFILFQLYFFINTADGYTIGSGGSSWEGNVSLTNTTIVRSTGGYVELQKKVNDYISYWRFDEYSGTIVRDENITTTADGIMSGGTRFKWDHGGAIDFDGINDMVSFSSINMTTISLFARVKSDTKGDSNYPRIIELPGYVLYVTRGSTSDRRVSFQSRRSGTDGAWRAPANSIADGISYSIAATYDSTSTSNKPAIYINNNMQTLAEASAPADTQFKNGGTGYIGNRNGADRSWDGLLDDVYIFNRILTVNEIQDISGGKLVQTGDLTAWHDAGAGYEIYQISVNATTPANTNYAVLYRGNATGEFMQLGQSYTGNNTIALSSRYQSTDVRVVLNGNQTATPELGSITFYIRSVY